jgi:Uma2 family endonuclease
MTIQAPAQPVARRLLTSEEFLEWLQPGVFADLIDGEVIMHSPVNLRHARLINFMDRLLSAYIEHEVLGELYRESWPSA